MSSFAKLIVERYPAWQILLVDLRCHGDSCSLPSNTHEPPHTLDNAAKDVLALLRHLKLFPHALVGHSFGGKVVMAMVRQFGTRLPRPLQVWVLDSLPGHVRSGELGGDHPERLIDTLRSLDLSRDLSSRTDLVNVLVDKGFSKMIAQWAATNLKQLPPSNSGSNGQLKWGFDLDGIKSLYRSYEEDDLYPLLENPPLGLKLDFVKAEHSSFRWGGDDEDRIKSLGHHVHVLPRSGHWVHTDNPNGLLSILEISFQDLSARLAAASKN